MNQRMFVAFEGVDGSGKTTQISRVAEAIREWNKYQEVVLTREPTHKATQLIRKLKSETDPMTNARKMTKLFVQDRKKHYQEIVEDMQKERVILCDRYAMSTLVYQSVQGQKIEELVQAHLDAKLGIPDITFYLALSANKAIKRLSGRNSKREKFEQPDFMMGLVKQYEKIYEDSTLENSVYHRIIGKVVRIDAFKTQEEVTRNIISELEPIYKQKRILNKI
jgi:dTMP kinase